MNDDLIRLRTLAGLKPLNESAKKVGEKKVDVKEPKDKKWNFETSKKDKKDVKEAKTFRDYLKEQDEGLETIGTDRNTAIKTIQNRMGPNGNQQVATRTFDLLKSKGAIKQDGMKMAMEPMGDEDFKTALGEDEEILDDGCKEKKIPVKKACKAKR